MERSKLVVGTKYAVSPQQNVGTWARDRTLLSADLHQQDRRTGKISAARPGAKATLGHGYLNSPIGVLMEDSDGKQEIVYPAHVKMTWDEFGDHQVRQAQARTQENARQEAASRRNAEMAAELKALWPAEVKSRPYFSDYGYKVDVSKSQLIELIKFLQTTEG